MPWRMDRRSRSSFAMRSHIMGSGRGASCDALFDLAEISSAPGTSQALCRLVGDGVDSQAWGKSIWWMPWHVQAKKDVARCDKRRGAVSKLWSGDFRMGKPTFTISSVSLATGRLERWIRYHLSEYIALVKRTRGTETSQYLEEKTSTEIPLVVASERGPGQCSFFN